MQIVIDIPEKVYSYIKREWVENDFDSPMNNAMNGIKNGTPLPKGHGDLVDRSKIDMSTEWRNVGLSDKSVWIANGILNNAKTVIPADKEDAE